MLHSRTVEFGIVVIECVEGTGDGGECRATFVSGGAAGKQALKRGSQIVFYLRDAGFAGNASSLRDDEIEFSGERFREIGAAGRVKGIDLVETGERRFDWIVLHAVF